MQFCSRSETDNHQIEMLLLHEDSIKRDSVWEGELALGLPIQWRLCGTFLEVGAILEQPQFIPSAPKMVSPSGMAPHGLHWVGRLHGRAAAFQRPTKKNK